ncbi:uncharacterized protein EV420DRAFT_1273265 [Desarmillaria tabescens]|uniref:Uncharacterized protein n=1 Tax=Armillaria tabescens TaxID=1929756 RepID=A0AA39K4B4_ARMTA|nr:uncharacterized protein EV420DRAFT_1273265 [Desarmillaria tabescens]KAK0454107.1 hypothetical protein EV420DRAFT_1273265 [Desarmillaria tabescens]
MFTDSFLCPLLEQCREAKAEAYKALTKAGYVNCFFWEQPIVSGNHDSFQKQSRLYWMRRIGHRIGGPSVAEAMIRGRGVSLILISIELILAYRPVASDNMDPAAFHLEASAFSLRQRAMVIHVKEVLVWYDYGALKKCVPEDRYIQAVWNKEPAGSKIESGQ